MKKWMDTDTFREILDSILRNKSRSFLTGFGVFWGIFMLMLLTGGSQGFKDLLNKNFEGFAQNTCIIATNNTTKPYKGFKKGRTWNLEYADVDRLKSMVPELETVSPTVSLWGKSVTRGENTSSRAVVKGARADYVNIETPKLMYGRYITDADNAQERKVCVIGKRVYNELFPEGGDPCGQRIRIDGSYYTVVGVDWKDGGGISINGSAADAVTRILADCGSEPCLPVSGISVLPTDSASRTALQSVTITESDLTDTPYEAKDALILHTILSGWSPGLLANISVPGWDLRGIIREKLIDADNLSGPWKSELLVERLQL